VQVIGEDAGVGAELAQRRRLVGDVERQPARLVPGRDRLDERPGGEVAVADGADAAAVDTRFRQAWKDADVTLTASRF